MAIHAALPATISEGAAGDTVKWLQYNLVRRTLSDATQIDGDLRARHQACRRADRRPPDMGAVRARSRPGARGPLRRPLAGLGAGRESTVGEHDRRLDLALGDRPVPPEQGRRPLRRDELESVAAIEADRPVSGGPCSDEHRPRAARPEIREQGGADAAPLRGRKHVGVPDQLDIPDRLESHDTGERAAGLIPPEAHARHDLILELALGHIRLVPAVGRDHAPVGLGCCIDDLEDRVSLVIAAWPDRSHAREST